MSENIQFTVKGFFKTPGTLTLDGEKAIFNGKKGCGGSYTDEVTINEVRFCDVIKNTIRFGYRELISIKGLKREEMEIIQKHLEEHGAKLGKGADWYTKGSNWCCGIQEQLAVVDDGVMFHYKKGRINESTFVEWDKVNISVFPGGCTGNFVVLLGELDIVTAKKFPHVLVDKIKTGIKTRGKAGAVYRPPIWKCKEHFKNCLILTDEGVVAKLSPKGVSASELPSNSKKGVGRTIFIPYDKITKIGNAKKMKGYFRIEGSIMDLRSQKPAAITMVMMKPFCWCSAKGKIKSRMRG
jgi:hypothetical protein